MPVVLLLLALCFHWARNWLYKRDHAFDVHHIWDDPKEIHFLQFYFLWCFLPKPGHVLRINAHNHNERLHLKIYISRKALIFHTTVYLCSMKQLLKNNIWQKLIFSTDIIFNLFERSLNMTYLSPTSLISWNPFKDPWTLNLQKFKFWKAETKTREKF